MNKNSKRTLSITLVLIILLSLSFGSGAQELDPWDFETHCLQNVEGALSVMPQDLSSTEISVKVAEVAPDFNQYNDDEPAAVAVEVTADDLESTLIVLCESQADKATQVWPGMGKSVELIRLEVTDDALHYLQQFWYPNPAPEVNFVVVTSEVDACAHPEIYTEGVVQVERHHMVNNVPSPWFYNILPDGVEKADAPGYYNWFGPNISTIHSFAKFCATEEARTHSWKIMQEIVTNKDGIETESYSLVHDHDGTKKKYFYH